MRGSVSELDADQVEIGQKLTVIFPFANRTIDASVTYIDKAIDSDSRAAKFRTTIGNPEGKLKAGMFVRMLLKVRPKSGSTLIPRAAMVSIDQYDYVFVKKKGTLDRSSDGKSFRKGKQRFCYRAAPSLGQTGLTPGEEVVTTGSLILDQMYEDRAMTEGGLLASAPGEGQRRLWISPRLWSLPGPTRAVEHRGVHLPGWIAHEGARLNLSIGCIKSLAISVFMLGEIVITRTVRSI